jgi:uncharacterized protein YjlB
MSDREPERHLLTDDGRIPNNPRLPLLVYRGALEPGPSDPAATFETAFARNGWRGAWRDGIYGFHHYHSTSHEVLGIARGSVRVRLGGEGGLATELRAGDVAVIPAGVGHKNEGSTPDLLVVGAYPDGRDWDLCRGEPGERPRVLDNIAAVPLPAADPLAGADGPLVAIWCQAKASR